MSRRSALPRRETTRWEVPLSVSFDTARLDSVSPRSTSSRLFLPMPCYLSLPRKDSRLVLVSEVQPSQVARTTTPSSMVHMA